MKVPAVHGEDIHGGPGVRSEFLNGRSAWPPEVDAAFEELKDECGRSKGHQQARACPLSGRRFRTTFSLFLPLRPKRAASILLVASFAVPK